MDTPLPKDFNEAFVNRYGFGEMTASANSDAYAIYRAAEWAWKASRESLVIELPDRYDWTAEQVGIFKDDEGTLFDADAVVEAIEAAGLKVKL